MKNSPICVDANFVVVLLMKSNSSVLAYWQKWLNEQRTIICPALMPFEVVNSLHQYWRHGLLPAEIVLDSINVFYDLPISVQTHPELHTRAAMLAQQLNLGAAYDAHYVALAQLFGAELWTLDARLHRRFSAITPVVHLVAS